MNSQQKTFFSLQNVDKMEIGNAFHLFGTIIIMINFWLGLAKEEASEEEKEVLIMTIPSSKTDGFRRFLRSAKVLGLPVEELEQKGKETTGSGKLALLMNGLEPYKDRTDLLVLFSNGHDAILLRNREDILNLYKSIGARIVFCAEAKCRPEDRRELYSNVEDGYRFLSADAFIGPPRDIYEMVKHKKAEVDGQTFFTDIYLDGELRKRWDIGLDHKAQLFQSLYGAKSDVSVIIKDGDPIVRNSAMRSSPALVHAGNAADIKLEDHLNNIGSYVPKAWNKECLICDEDTVEMERLPEVPVVLLAIFIEKATPFLEEFFDLILKLDYPKEKIDIFIHNKQVFHAKEVDKFFSDLTEYNSVKLNTRDDEGEARSAGIDRCLKIKCDFYFSIDSEARLDNPQTLKLLIEQHRPVLTPMLVWPYKNFANFWGSITSLNSHGRSHDYKAIIDSTRRGLWNAIHVSDCYLIEGKILHDPATRPSFYGSPTPSFAFNEDLWRKGVFKYVSNVHDFGHLCKADYFNTTQKHNELWEIKSNRKEWEERYLHEDYSKTLEMDITDMAQPCTDVYWFPLVSTRFGDELVEELEHYGIWSKGNGQLLEPHLGGYKDRSVDIQLKQIGFQQEWLYFLTQYLAPMQEKIYTVFVQRPVDGELFFVIKYQVDVKPYMEPHHDSSLFTVNIALNEHGVDFEGGGVRFIRYNCSISKTRKGWALIHPGRLTHYHEGLSITNGTRYVLVSFCHPHW